MSELPKRIMKGDARIGKRARASDGFEGVVVTIYRFSDGYEMFSIKKGAIEKGGVTQEEITFLEEE